MTINTTPDPLVAFYINNEKIFWDVMHVRPMYPNICHALHTDIIDVYRAYVLDVPVNIFYAKNLDRRYYKGRVIPATCQDEYGAPIVSGNILVFRRDAEGNCLTLSQMDQLIIRSRVYLGVIEEENGRYPITNNYYIEPITRGPYRLKENGSLGVTDIDWE